jgi:hypothetical protein
MPTFDSSGFSRVRAVSNRKMILNCETKYFFCERTPPIFNDGFSSLLPQAVGAVGKWESCLWISTLSTDPPFPRLSSGFCFPSRPWRQQILLAAAFS